MTVEPMKFAAPPDCIRCKNCGKEIYDYGYERVVARCEWLHYGTDDERCEL